MSKDAGVHAALDSARYGRLFVAVQILVQRFAPFLFKKLAKFCGGRIAFSEVLAVLLPQRAYERVAAFLTDRAVLVGDGQQACGTAIRLSP